LLNPKLYIYEIFYVIENELAWVEYFVREMIGVLLA